MDKQKIINIMIGQHRSLLRQLVELKQCAINEKNNPDFIHDIMQHFTLDLKAHLKLENNVFYVELLKEMHANGDNALPTEKFIEEMKEIEKTVQDFLEKYAKAEVIVQKMSEFSGELDGIINALNMRIDAEESGIYLYWS